ncbi:MAG: hypothetical protein WAM75_22035 [Xanthobacteraceae bacterium]
MPSLPLIRSVGEHHPSGAAGEAVPFFLRFPFLLQVLLLQVLLLQALLLQALTNARPVPAERIDRGARCFK